jgi:tetratricopeptide (TPR) repeat protein
VSAAGSLPEEEVRHGWLHYLLDEYTLKYPNIVNSKAALLPVTQRAPALEEAFRENFGLLLTESLIRAVQARRAGGEERAQLRAVQDAVEEGMLLTAYFYQALKIFEGQPVGMRLYFPEMVDAIDVGKEKDRLAEVQFRAAPQRASREQQWSPYERLAREAEQHLARREYQQAQALYESLAKQFGPRAEVMYGLALAASQLKQPEQAKGYFRQAADLASDPGLRAWSHVYLGRILDLEGKREEAVAEYSAALAAAEGSTEARTAAEQGLQEPFARSGGEGSPGHAAPAEPERPRVPLGRTN